MERKIVHNVVLREFSFRITRNGQTAEEITVTAESQAAAMLKIRSMYPEAKPDEIEEWRESK